MTKSKSLRSQIILLMTVVVALQSVALVLSLVVSQVFSILDAESVRLFNDTSSTRAESFNHSVGELVAGMVIQTNTVSGQLEQIADDAGIPAADLFKNQATHDAVLEATTEAILDTLNVYNVTGAFLMLNGSYYSEGADSHNMVYIRTASPGVANRSPENYMVEVGSITLGQDYKIPLSAGWTLDYSTGGSLPAFYTNPHAAAQQFPGSEMERYGYWNSPSDLMGDGVQVVTYTMPLLDSAGNAFGVFGVELSLNYLTREYMAYTELPFQNSFYTIAVQEESAINLEWYIPGGTVAQVYLEELDRLELSPSGREGLYRTSLPGLGDMFVSLQELHTYSRNSPFAEDDWTLVAFVSVDALTETSRSVQTLLIGSIIATTLVAMATVFALAFISTRKIRGLSNKINRLRGVDNIHIGTTGLTEIDELTSALEKLNKRVVNSSKRISKIMELTEMPIGCFEIMEGGKVFLTEQVYGLLNLLPGQSFDKDSWAMLLSQAMSQPEPDFENVYSLEAPGGSPRWLRILESEGETGTVGIILDVSETVLEHKRLSKRLDHDSMTGLYNRAAFKREAHRKIKREPDAVGAMIFADLDNLKYVNDNYGHETGDTLLQLAGEMYARLEPYGIVARIAGDEFAMYVHGVGDKLETRSLIHEIFSQNNATFTTQDGKVHRIRFSAGICWYPQDADNVTDLLKLSDFAMYEAKHKRKGTVVEFNPDSYKETAYLLENTETISRLLDEKLVRFDYQPIVSLVTGKVFGYEALLRSKMPEFQNPTEILAVASAQSKLYQLERLVMDAACEALQENHRQLGDARLFVNSLPSQSLTRQDLELIQQQYADVFNHMVIEITEDENTPLTLIREKSEMLRSFGNLIAIDDFGAGYSNELRILTMRPDFIKIDIGIIQDISHDSDKEQLVSSILSFCKPKGIRTIAEGVETAEDLLAVQSLGIDYVQGFYVGKPQPGLLPPVPEAVELITIAGQPLDDYSI